MDKPILVAIAVVAFLLVVVLAVFGSDWGLFPLVDCTGSPSCWEEAVNDCGPAKINQPASQQGIQLEQYYELRGRNFLTGHCVMYYKIVSIDAGNANGGGIIPEEYVAEGKEILNSAEGKDMVCSFSGRAPAPVLTVYIPTTIEKRWPHSGYYRPIYVSTFSNCNGELRTVLEDFLNWSIRMGDIVNNPD